MLNLGIVGAGYIAGVMADTVRRLNETGNNEVRLYAIASRTKEKADAFAQKYGIEKSYGSYQDLYEDRDVDLVYIATPHSSHYEDAQNCLNHGKHVLCEKAFTVNARQAERLFTLAEEKKLLITEAIWTRYQPMRKIIKDEVDSGIIGQPMVLTANLGFAIAGIKRLALPELAGGALLDVGIYPLNFAEMVFGQPDSVEGSCVMTKAGVDLTDSMTLEWFDSGRMAVLNASAAGISDQYGIIHGTTGFIVVDKVLNPQSLKVFDSERRLIREVKGPAQLTGYEYEVLETADCINRGLLECPSMPHSDTIHMMNVMDSLRMQFGLKYPHEIEKV